MTSEIGAFLSAAARDLIPGDLLIEGEWHQGLGGAFDSVDPSSGEPLWTLGAASMGQVEAAVAAARRAFDQTSWARSEPRTRQGLLEALASQMDANRDALEELVVADVGTPISLAKTLQVQVPINNIRWFAAAAARGPRGGYREAIEPHFGSVLSSSMLLREPVGVVAGLVGYNYPLYLTVWKLGAALAAGCSIVLMPSPRGALAVLALAELVRRAGLPPGVVNVVVGPPQVGQALVDHPDVDMVSFTGSEAAGVAVMSTAARTIKKVVLELGGKSPDIVLPGVDPSQIFPAAVHRFTRNAGQGCGATTRLLVPQSRFDEFADAACEALSALRVGNPRDAATDVGPLISDTHRDGVLQQLHDATARGGTILTGGTAPSVPGYFITPTLVSDLPNQDPLAQDELFAPVSVILPYNDLEEAVALANQSRYGLSANVWGDTTTALDIASRLRVGNVTINGGGDVRPESPWGGFKRSGNGREMGEDGFAEYFETKHVQWRIQ